MQFKEANCTYHQATELIKSTFCIAEYKSSKQFNMKIKESLCTYHSHTEMKKKHILQCKIQIIKTVQYEMIES